MNIIYYIIILLILLYFIKYYNSEHFEPASTQMNIVSGPVVSNPIIPTTIYTTPMINQNPYYWYNSPNYLYNYWYNPLDYWTNPYVYYNWNSYSVGSNYNTRYYNHRNKFRKRRHHK